MVNKKVDRSSSKKVDLSDRLNFSGKKNSVRKSKPSSNETRTTSVRSERTNNKINSVKLKGEKTQSRVRKARVRKERVLDKDIHISQRNNSLRDDYVFIENKDSRRDNYVFVENKVKKNDNIFVRIFRFIKDFIIVNLFRIFLILIILLILFLLWLFFNKKDFVKDNSPSFDVVRIEGRDALIAGRAKPDSKVYVVAGKGEEEVILGAEIADENGEWVFINEEKLPVGDVKLSLYTEEGNEKIYSKRDAILQVSEKEGQSSFAMLTAGEDGKTKMLQNIKGVDGKDVSLAKIDYDMNGKFIMQGFAKKDTAVKVYVNGKLVDEVSAENGTWELDKKYELNRNQKYDVKVNMVDKNGSVLKAMDYNFTAMFDDLGKGSQYNVKKGDCLWNIASKDFYGDGTSYVVLFDVNKNQIKDPDLIYPNQVLFVPSKESNMYMDKRRKYFN